MRPARSVDRRVKLPYRRRIGEVAGQRHHAVAGVRGGGLDPGGIGTDREHRMAGAPQGAGHGDPGRAAAAGDQDVQGASVAHPAFMAWLAEPAAGLVSVLVSVDPVMPAVDSITVAHLLLQRLVEHGERELVVEHLVGQAARRPVQRQRVRALGPDRGRVAA